MTNCTENNNESSSSSPTSAEVPQGFTVYGRMSSSSSIRGIRSLLLRKGTVRNWGRRPTRIPMWNEVHDDRTFGDEKEDISVSNPVGLDDVFLSTVRCHLCDFDIEVSLRYGRSKDYDANNMICPVCDEKLGEDVIRTLQNLSFPIVRKDNVYGRSFNYFSSDEDSIAGASDFTAATDVSISKSFGGAHGPNASGDEEDVEERSDRAAFVQYLFVSALFSA